MKIVYDMSVDDSVAFSVYHVARSPSCRRRQLLLGLIFPLIIFGGLCGLSLSKGDWAGAFIAVIFFILLSLWILSGNRRQVEKLARKMLKEGGNKIDLGLQELEVTSEGLADKNEFSESRINWKAVERIVSTPGHYYIYVGAVKALVVPKLKVIEGDFEEFRHLVEEGFRRAVLAEGVDFDESRLVVDDKAVRVSDPGRKSCGCGVVSLVGGVLAASFYGLVIGMVIVAVVSQQGEEAVEAPSSAVYLVMAALAANLLGVVCGISGLFNPNQKKLLPIIGLVINGGILFVIAILVMIAIIFGR